MKSPLAGLPARGNGAPDTKFGRKPNEEDIDCILNARHLFASERMTSMHAAHNELEEIHKKEAIQRRLKEKFKSKAKSKKALNSLTDEEAEFLD